MRTFTKLFMLAATLLVIGFNTLQYMGISSVVGAAASASSRQELLVAGMKVDLDNMISTRGLVRRFEAPGPMSPPDSQGQMVYADKEGNMDRAATALADRLNRESTVSTFSSAGTGIGAAIGIVLSGGMLCISVAVWLVVMLVGFVVLAVTKPRITA